MHTRTHCQYANDLWYTSCVALQINISASSPAPWQFLHLRGWTYTLQVAKATIYSQYENYSSCTSTENILMNVFPILAPPIIILRVQYIHIICFVTSYITSSAATWNFLHFLYCRGGQTFQALYYVHSVWNYFCTSAENLLMNIFSHQHHLCHTDISDTHFNAFSLVQVFFIQKYTFLHFSLCLNMVKMWYCWKRTAFYCKSVLQHNLRTVVLKNNITN